MRGKCERKNRQVFLTLYRFEMRKLRRKTTMAAVLLGMLMMAVLTAWPVGQDGYYYRYEAGWELPERVLRPAGEIELIRREYLTAFEGRKLDETLMSQWKEAYLDSEAGTAQWNLNEYTPFLYLNTREELTEASAADFYETYNRLSLTEEEKEELTEAELAYWEAKAASLPPYTVGYAGIWKNMLSVSSLYSLVTLLVTAVGTCDLFSREHRLRTDQLTLTGAKGRRCLFAAKLAAGSTLSVGTAVLGAVVQLAVGGLLYGFDGAEASVQLLLAGNGCLYRLSAGQAVILLAALLALVAAAAGIFIMLLSEWRRSPLPGLVVSFLFGIMSMLGTLRQVGGTVRWLCSYLPTERIRTEILTEYHLVRIGGRLFHCIEVSFILYPLLAVLLGFLCWKCYDGFQVTGR